MSDRAPQTLPTSPGVLMRRAGGCLLFALVLMLVARLVWPPPVESVETDPYFETLQAALRERGVARPCVLIDLDRLDANLAQVKSVLGTSLAFRATTKSLPSYDLLNYVLRRMGSRRVMEFHGPHLVPLLENLATSDPAEPPLDVLLGKPLPGAALETFLDGAGALQGRQYRVRWLIDDPQRLAAYRAIVERRDAHADIALEVDVGLHRGGLADPAALSALWTQVQAAAPRLQLVGLLGYEGHVPHAPSLGPGDSLAQAQAFGDAVTTLHHVVQRLRAQAPALLGADFVINSGGSKTYPRYHKDALSRAGLQSAATELAIGSALLKPADFDVPLLATHQPALFIADPVLKRVSPGKLPFLDAIGSLWRRWNRNRHDVIYLYGGGWALRPTYPVGLSSNPLYNDRPSDNRIPNQTLLNVAKSHPIQSGDLVFFRPAQADVLTQFEEIILVRGGRMAGTWHPIPRRL